MWVVKYYDINGRRRQTTIGPAAQMTKAEAQVERERFMATINEDAAEQLVDCPGGSCRMLNPSGGIGVAPLKGFGGFGIGLDVAAELAS